MSTIQIYKSYSFRTKDPVIDQLRTVLKDQGLLSGKGYEELQRRGACKAGTYRNWFNGETRRPQFASLQATAHAAGFHFKLVKRSNSK